VPLYEYRCKVCGHAFERIQKFSDPLVVDCPKCHAKKTVEKLLSAPAVQFKGSGWYATDYADKQKSGGAAATEPKAEVSGSKVDAEAGKSTSKKTTSPTKKS